MVPFLVRFSPQGALTSGLEAVYPGSQLVADGVCIVTKFLATEGYVPPTPVTTGWTICCAAVTTGWTSTYLTPSTGWTLV